MAVSLLESHLISELCLGKPPLTSLPLSATVADAFAALKSSDDPILSVWDCHCCHRRHHHHHAAAAASAAEPHCRCVGKVSMADIICFLARLDQSSSSSSTALATPISTLISNNAPALVFHLDSSSSLSEAIDLILQGAQNLVIPITRRQTTVTRKKQSKTTLISSSTTTVHNGTEYCWLTQEDILRFLLNSIGLFSPIAALSVETLGIISTDDALTADYHSPAISAIDLIFKSLTDQSSVAVVDADGVLIGEISPQTLASCDETAAAAIATLSAGELMAYIDGGGPPPEDLVREVNRRMEERSLGAIIKELRVLFSESSSSSSSSSSDDESATASPTTTLARRFGRSASYSARMVRRAEAIVCHPKSSLVAVMIQAIAHRVSYVWVVDHDSCLVGIVTFSEILRIFRECTMP